MVTEQLYNESLLLKRLTAGDREAFTQLYHAYNPLVLQYALSLLKSKQQAQDIGNDIFANLWQNRHTLQNVQSLKAYLLTAARNRAINALKSMARSHSSMKEIRRSFGDKSIETEEQLLEKEYVAFIKKQIEGLPARSKQVFTLCREEGYSYDEVSTHLGISRNAVKSHMVYSMKKLKAFVKKDLGISFSILLILLLHF